MTDAVSQINGQGSRCDKPESGGNVREAKSEGDIEGSRKRTGNDVPTPVISSTNCDVGRLSGGGLRELLRVRVLLKRHDLAAT